MRPASGVVSARYERAEATHWGNATVSAEDGGNFARVIGCPHRGTHRVVVPDPGLPSRDRAIRPHTRRAVPAPDARGGPKHQHRTVLTTDSDSYTGPDADRRAHPNADDTNDGPYTDADSTTAHSFRNRLTDPNQYADGYTDRRTDVSIRPDRRDEASR